MLNFNWRLIYDKYTVYVTSENTENWEILFLLIHKKRFQNYDIMFSANNEFGKCAKAAKMTLSSKSEKRKQIVRNVGLTQNYGNNIYTKKCYL